MVNNPLLEQLLPNIKGNIGFVFTKDDLVSIRDMLVGGAGWPRFGLVVVAASSRRDCLHQMIGPQVAEMPARSLHQIKIMVQINYSQIICNLESNFFWALVTK
jgi:hypothetical protein